MVAEPAVEDDDRLVAAVRRGDDRAFEGLYSRYHRRIHAYVVGMVKDHGRAEDITQEVFLSALRRMRATERPIAFKPWIYEIAKNACIDQFRRSRRAEEISLQAEDGFAAADYGRLVGSGPAPDDAVAAKQELDNLCGALGEMSDTHHEILLLRELEGLSYAEIGEQLGMSRPAVESTLFRARRRLTEEYGELASGARCRRIQGLIATATESRLGARDTRRLSRHVAYCQACRREAFAAGLDASFFTHLPLRKRAAAKIASLLPFPIFARWRHSLVANAPAVSEQASAGWGKVAAVAAVLVAGAGAAGVGTQVAPGGGDPPSKQAPARSAPAAHQSAAAPKMATRAAGARAKAAPKGAKAGRSKANRRSGGTRTASQRTGGGSSQNPTAPVQNAVNGAAGAVNGATNTASGAANGAAGAVNGAANGAAGAVNGAANGAAGAVNGAANGAAGAVGGATNGAAGAVGGATSGAAGAVGGATSGATGAVGGATNGATGAVNGATGGVNNAVSGATGEVNGATGAVGDATGSLP